MDDLAGGRQQLMLWQVWMKLSYLKKPKNLIFRLFPMNLTASTSLEVEAKYDVSKNVIAKIHRNKIS
jgi:hypothetical protein